MTFPRTLAALALLATLPAAAGAQTCHGGRCRRPVVYYRVQAVQPVYYRAAPVPVQQAPQVESQAPNGYLAALSIINAERARLGRGPLQWSANLAAFAATNSAQHAPGSSGGGSQAWAGVADPVAAVRMWFASGPHHSILINAVYEVGISVCPSGCSANAR